jgi:hypothetical protein
MIGLKARPHRFCGTFLKVKKNMTFEVIPSTYTSKPGIRLVWRRLVASSLLLIIAGSTILQAQDQLFYFLYQHSFFNNKNWQRTSDSINYDIPESLYSMMPVVGRMAGAGNANMAAFSTSNGNLYLTHVEAVPPPTQYSRWNLTATEALPSPAGTKAEIFTIFAPPSGAVDTIFLAYSDTATADTIFTCRIKSATNTIIDRDTIILTPAAPLAKIRSIEGAPKHSGEQVTGIWITGTYGLVRYLSWNGTGWNGATTYDIRQSLSVTAFNNQCLGTDSGYIFERQVETFIEAAQPATTALRFITPTGAVGDKGVVIKKIGGSWQSFTVGTADYCFAGFSPRTAGSGVEMLDKGWNYTTAILQNSPTTFSLLPDSLKKYINGPALKFSYYMKPETLTVVLHDVDANYRIPAITLNSTIFLSENKTTGQKLNNACPDTVPTKGYLELADSTLMLILRNSEVRLLAKARIGKFNTSRGFFWKDTLFENSSSSWNPSYIGNEIAIKQGNQVFTIAVEVNISVELADIAPSRQCTYFDLHPRTNGLSFHFVPGTLADLTVYDLKGRILANTAIPRFTGSFDIPLPMVAGAVCIEYRLTNGTIQRRSFTIMR